MEMSGWLHIPSAHYTVDWVGPTAQDAMTQTKVSAHITDALTMEAVRTSETLVYSETTRRYIQEGSNLLIFFVDYLTMLSE
jgi:hypothetical protein